MADLLIKDGKVYLLDRDDAVGDKLRCFDLSDGKELWHYAYDAPGSVMFPGSRSVPTVDGGRVYTCGHNGDLHCIDVNTHKPVWKANVWTDFGGKPPSREGGFRRGPSEPGSFPIWAITQNPLVYGDLLIVASQAPRGRCRGIRQTHGRRQMENAIARRCGLCQPEHRQRSTETTIW